LVKLVLDASAGFELLLETVTGQRLLDVIPPSGEWWVPEHYFLETAAAIRRAELKGLVVATAAEAAVDRLLSTITP
jgi:predicted nucleic acid-binding protein